MNKSENKFIDRFYPETKPIGFDFIREDIADMLHQYRAEFVETVLEKYRQEWPFDDGDESSHSRDRYYFLKGFLNDCL